MKKRIFIFLSALLAIIQVKADDDFALIRGETPFRTIPFNVSAAKDATYSLCLADKDRNAIVGLSIDGDFTRTEKYYFVRVLLKDIEGHEYLIMESYREKSDAWSYRFSNYCEETIRLNNVVPDSVKIYVRGGLLHLRSVNYLEGLSHNGHSLIKSLSVKRKELRLRQIEGVVSRINSYNKAHNKLWRAGRTELSMKDFEERMRILGISNSEYTGGVEYYADGIFEIGDMDDFVNNNLRTSSSLSFVGSFDWRNQHGKNWMTPVKDQGDSGYCSAFTAISTTEAMSRLYYNQLIDFDLSEQEAACCNGTTNTWTYGMAVSDPLRYICDNGVCDEQAYPFVNSEAENICRSSEITPNELVSIGGYSYVPSCEDSIKKALIKHGPLASAVSYWGWDDYPNTFTVNHAMAIVGFGQLQAGDTIFHWIEPNGFANGDFVVHEGDPHIGMTYLIYKNNYYNHDTARGGYMYYIHYNYGRSVHSTYYVHPQISSMNYTDNDIICEDADGDGYYFWGIGAKPSWLPGWIPQIKDGNDNNHLEGKMYYEAPYVIGSLEPLNTDGYATLQINGNTTYSNRQSIYSHIRINSNAILTVHDILNLFGRVTISIEAGGELVVDGGVITNVSIDFSTGGKLTLKNGGKLVMRTGTDFDVPVGVLADIENGEICRSNDF